MYLLEIHFSSSAEMSTARNVDDGHKAYQNNISLFSYMLTNFIF